MIKAVVNEKQVVSLYNVNVKYKIIFVEWTTSTATIAACNKKRKQKNPLAPRVMQDKISKLTLTKSTL